MIGSETEWDRYSYVHAQVVIDKLNGRIAELVAEKGRLSADEARTIAEHALDAYINSYYRSASNLRDGLLLAAHLDAADSIPPLITALFAFQQRVRPFDKFLSWELERLPLDRGAWSAGRLLPRLETIIATGDVSEQQRLFRDVEQLGRTYGFGKLVDGWEPELAWLSGDATAPAR